MNDGVIKEEVIEEEYDFTFQNGGYIEVKQEEVEQKPEYLLEKEIKTEPVDFFENNNSDEFFEDVERKSEESNSKVEKVWKEGRTLICKICQKRMPRHLSKLIKLEEEKTVLSEIFEVEGFLETRMFYVCVSHIQMIISDNDGKVKITKKLTEQLMRSFIRRNTYLMQVNKNL
ncbi:hypothetical protein B9Z55_021078 [Caenorhabditis nigoni]|uniref:Uncharacterized protein n=1 Tax=Caenorhabditis nigoni TaxID=1611254 RepID=A0A2G5TQH9_9PELO|nr:hypothetical protein B9Z55_021078 [Caenorhabditis nigoni]